MPGLLSKIAELTDEQLAESSMALASAKTDDMRFVRAAMLMEQDRRRGKGVKGDLPGHPFRGNQWSGGAGGLSAEEKVNAHDRLDKMNPGRSFVEASDLFYSDTYHPEVMNQAAGKVGGQGDRRVPRYGGIASSPEAASPQHAEQACRQ